MSTSWPEAFLFTQAFEVPIYLGVMHAQKLELDWPRRALVSFGASALTHPIVWFVLPLTIRLIGFWGYVAIAETFAVGAEAVYLGMFGVKRPLLWSLVANAASAGIGLTLRHFFGWP